MTRLAACLLFPALLVAACGDETPSTTVPPISGSIHLSGGFAAIDETWVLGADGSVQGPDGYTGTAPAEALASLAAAVAAAGFFDLESEYLPADQCCDRITYELTLTQGRRTHTVATIDAAPAPAGLFAVIGAFLAAARPG